MSSSAHGVGWRARPAAVLLVLFLLLAAHPALAQVTLRVDAKSGDKVSDVAHIVAHAESPAGISKVEFIVDDHPPVEHDSVPYYFDWDTIKDAEGPHTLTVTATDEKGAVKTVKVDLIVDNDLGSGANALAQRGQEALANHDNAAAVRYSRRALKADPGNVTAIRLLAAVAAANSDLNAAVAAFDGAKGLDESSPGLTDLARYRLRRLLQPGYNVDIPAELQAILDLRRKAADLALAQARTTNGGSSPDNLAAVGDALLADGRAAEAADVYGKGALATDAPVSLINRYMLSLILAHRVADVAAVYIPLRQSGKADAATHAVIALALQAERRFADSRAVVQPDLLQQQPACLVMASLADATVGKASAITEARDAVGVAPTAGEAWYARALTLPVPAGAAGGPARLARQEAAYRAIELAPLQPGPYLFYAAAVASERRGDRYDLAMHLIDIALKLDPENINARIMQTLIYLQTSQLPAAEPVFQRLVKDYPRDPDMMVLQEVYWNVHGQAGRANNFLNNARKADPELFNLGAIQTPLEYLETLNLRLHYRADPFLTVATLYPTASP